MSGNHHGAVGVSMAVPAVLCVLTAALPFLVLAGAGGAASPPPGQVCGAGGTGTTVAGVTLSAEQIANAHTIVTVTANRHLPAYASTIALATAWTEAKLINTTTQTDHDSEGLFQQRVSIYTAAVADDPVKATNAFLNRLTAVTDWQHRTVEDDAQTVQISQYPDRYATNSSLGAALNGLLWPTAVTAAAPVEKVEQPGARPGAPPGAPSGALCPGDGAGPPRGSGDPVAGTPAIPAGLVLSGSAAARAATRFALAQLGKPYVFGAAGPDSYDCSGLTMAAWAAAGVPLPHLTSAQALSGTPEPPDLSGASSGDLVLIPGSDGTAAHPGHVGMIVGRTHGRLYLIQAPGYRDLPIEITDASEWHGDIVAVRHIH